MQTISDEALIREAYARLLIWADGCRELHERAAEARKILLLQDPRQDAPGHRGEPTLQLQTLKSTFQNCVADQLDNMPEAVLLPETPALTAVSDDLTDVVRCVLSQNEFESLHRRRVEDCFCTGTAITQIAWDDDLDGGRGNVALIRWPIEAFLWDPAAETLQEARALFKVSWHPMSWFREHYPEHAEHMTGDDTAFSAIGLCDDRRDRAFGDEDRAMLLEYWWRQYDAATRRYQVNMALLAGGRLLYRQNAVYAHGRYPFVADVYTPIEGLPVGDGLIQELAPMMRYVNRYAGYIDTNLRMSSKGRLLVDRGAGLNRRALSDWQTDIIEGDRIDAGAVKWLQSVPFSPLAAQQMLQLQTDIKQDSGQNEFTRGEPVGGVTAASAISALQEAGGKMTRLRTASLNQGFKQMVEQMLWLIHQFYGANRVLMITGHAGARLVDAGAPHLFGGEPDPLLEAGGVLPPPRYRVQVQVQRRNPLRQQAQNELLLQAFELCAKAGRPIPVEALFEAMQVDGKERVLALIRQGQALEMQTMPMQPMQPIPEALMPSLPPTAGGAG